MKTWSSLAVLSTLGALGVAAVVVGQRTSGPHVVFLIGEDEYKTETTLPAFARSDLHWATRMRRRPRRRGVRVPGQLPPFIPQRTHVWNDNHVTGLLAAWKRRG